MDIAIIPVLQIQNWGREELSNLANGTWPYMKKLGFESK